MWNKKKMMTKNEMDYSTIHNVPILSLCCGKFYDITCHNMFVPLDDDVSIVTSHLQHL